MTVSAFDYSADVVLKDGSTVHLRPIRAEDDDRLLELLQRMSEEALYYRFLTIPKQCVAHLPIFPSSSAIDSTAFSFNGWWVAASKWSPVD